MSTCGVLFGSILGPFWVHTDYCLNTDASLGFRVKGFNQNLDKNQYLDKNQLLDKNTL